MLKFNTEKNNSIISSIYESTDIVDRAFYIDKLNGLFQSITPSSSRERDILQISHNIALESFRHVFNENTDDSVVVSTLEKYIGCTYGTDNPLIRGFDHIITDYVNNTILEITQKCVNHSDALSFRGTNENAYIISDNDKDSIRYLHESEVYDFISTLCHCDMLDDGTMTNYMNDVTECFITNISECMRTIIRSGTVTNWSSVPLRPEVLETTAFPNGDFIYSTCESLSRLQDIEESSPEDIDCIKELLNNAYERDYVCTSDESGNIGELYHSYFTLINHMINNLNKLNDKTLLWCCGMLSSNIEKLYFSCKESFVSTMVEILYLTLIIAKVSLGQSSVLDGAFNDKAMNQIMYYIYKMRQLLFSENNDLRDPTIFRYDNECIDTNRSFEGSAKGKECLDINDVIVDFRLSMTTIRNTIDKSTECPESACTTESVGDTQANTSCIGKYSGTYRSQDILDVLTESFEILSDGSIKVTIPKKTTYMEEYAANHRLIKENAKIKDYEAMRYNLVYCVLLAESIENKVMHNKKIDEKSNKYAEAVKARSFALNDISTYLPLVKQNIPDFDLNEFYSEVKAQKATVKIDTIATVSGVKRILKYILLK